jgi:hypothetical protein
VPDRYEVILPPVPQVADVTVPVVPQVVQVGVAGPQGVPGVVAAIPPITYDPDTQTVGFDGELSDLSDVDTAGAATDDLLTFDGSEWTPTDSPTVDAVQFDVTADEGEPVTGQLVWNAEEGTLDLGLNGDEGTFLHVGQESVYRVSNRTGQTIVKGAVVGFGGTIGQSGRLLGVLFDASSAPAKTIMGVAADDIPNDADGYVVAFGKVRKVNTAFPGWVEGDILFADPAVPGGLTRVQPTSPNAIVTVAALVTRSAQVGELFVRPTFAPSLTETQDVRLTAPADGEVLAYDGALGLWVNEPVPADAVQSVNGQTGTVVLDAADVGAYADDNPSGFVDAAGAAAAAPVQSVNSLSGTVVLDAAAVGAYPDTNPSGFVDAAGAAAAAPVQSVNGAVGTVVLDAAAVGAYPDSNPSGFIDAAGAPVQSVNTLTGDVLIPTVEVSATAPDNLLSIWADTSEQGDAVLPLGGAAGQSLVKVSGDDYDTAWADLDTDGVSEGTTNLYNRVPAGGSAGEVLVKQSATDFDLGYGLRALSFPLASGQFYGFGSGTTAIPNNETLLMHAFVVWEPTVIDRLLAQVLTDAGESDSVLRMGIYAPDSTGKPSSLIVDAGTVSTSTTGLKGIDISPVTVQGLFYLAAVCQAAPSTRPRLRSIGINERYAFSADPSASGSVNAYVRYTVSSVTGALPSTITPVTSAVSVPTVLFRVAS